MQSMKRKMLWILKCRFTALAVTACAMTLFGTPRSSTAQSTLPVPPVKRVPKPSGPVGGLKVLDWAGFKSAVTFTFDDSLSSQIDNYPQLQATGVHMTFFLVGGNNPDSPVWARAAKDGHELGNHTQHHCRSNATGCAWGAYAGSLEAEYDQCTQLIEQKDGVPDVWTTASPYGDTGFDQVAATRFFLNRGVRGGQIAPNDNSDAFNLPTHVASAGETSATSSNYIDTAEAAGKWQIFLYHSMGGDNGYAPVNVDDVVGTIRHAQSLHDVWIDTMVNVGAYWAGQKAVTNATARQAGNTTILTWTLPAHFPPGKYIRVTVTGGTLQQGGHALAWNDGGYYEVALDARSLTIAP